MNLRNHDSTADCVDDARQNIEHITTFDGYFVEHLADAAVFDARN